MHVSTCISVLIILCFFSPSKSLSNEVICDYTPFPSFCNSMRLQNNFGSLQEYVRFILQQSISSTQNVLSIIDGYLELRIGLQEYTFHALEDCQLLTSLNIDFFVITLEAINFTDTIEGPTASELLSLLSATLTNYQTCLDGLEAVNPLSAIKIALQTPLSDGNMLNSVALAIFKYAWIPHTREGKKLEDRKPQDAGLKLYPGGNAVNVSKSVVVNPNGSGDFTTVTDAVAAAPNNTDCTNGYFLIYIAAGVYKENVYIAKSKRYLMMIGDGIDQTIITGNRSVVDGWTTFNTATFAVTGVGFVAVNITFRNTAGAVMHQAVAVRNGADLSTFYQCSFEGYQDTLYAHTLRQFYRECNIYGTVDFIFGNAAVVFQNCNIYPRLPMEDQFNAITAQGRIDINQNTGTSIQNCTISAAEYMASTKTYLGRPWKEYSRAVYLNSFIDKLIDPAGRVAWSGDFALNTSYYAEYNNRGLGSDTSNRVTWEGYHVINVSDATNFTVSNLLAGDFWLPSTGVPYYGGLF
ncbi:pectinesterase-like [Apium graveolens]|uniref:pectinesterase-like n=1 Tax=Apium graveolens TaxID=4045 RepID=UPI003D7A14CC